MKNLTLIAWTRIFFGLLGAGAIITQLAQSIASDRSIANFFSFFTIESNILAAIMLVTMGVYTLLGKKGRQIAFSRGAITLYMTMTGIIYVLLLSGNEVALQATVPWVNIVLHYVMPVVVLADWLLFPPKEHVSVQQGLTWLLFPVAYFVYSLVRGAFTDWYPYPFMNPITNGWPSVVAMTIIIGFGITILAWLLALRTGRHEQAHQTM
jgi:hypothetical protein